MGGEDRRRPFLSDASDGNGEAIEKQLTRSFDGGQAQVVETDGDDPLA
jgi:hypothetical protein